MENENKAAGEFTDAERMRWAPPGPKRPDASDWDEIRQGFVELDADLKDLKDLMEAEAAAYSPAYENIGIDTQTHNHIDAHAHTAPREVQDGDVMSQSMPTLSFQQQQDVLAAIYSDYQATREKHERGVASPHRDTATKFAIKHAHDRLGRLEEISQLLGGGILAKKYQETKAKAATLNALLQA